MQNYTIKKILKGSLDSISDTCLADDFFNLGQEYLSIKGDKLLNYRKTESGSESLLFKSLSDRKAEKITAGPHKVLIGQIVVPKAYGYIRSLINKNYTMLEVSPREEPQKRFRAVLDGSSLRGLDLHVSRDCNLKICKNDTFVQSFYDKWPVISNPSD